MKMLYTLLLSLMITSMSSCQELRKVTCTLLNEDGTTVEGASIHVAYIGQTSKNSTRSIGKSNPLGVFVAKGHAPLRMKIMVDKEGYYPSVVKKLSRSRDHNITLEFRKIKNPIPLYARHVSLSFPVNGEWIGYDFKLGDWVAPHGIGKTNNILFRCETVKTGERDGKGSLEIKFMEDEGLHLVENKYLLFSKLKMPHLASEDGYTSQFKREENSFRNKNYRNNIGYFFKVRSAIQNDNEVSYNYGKLQADIRFSPRHFKYLNHARKV